jgi:uncharacterized protein (DUF58 family)
MSSRLLPPEVLQKLGGLSLKARRMAEGMLTGLHKSPHHGASIEFAEHKEYTPGDDMRHIDWKAYGRLDRYYVKQFEQETNLRGFLLVDSSASMSYQSESAPRSKQEQACVLAACLAYVLLRQQDSAGLLTFSEQPLTYIPPRATSRHLAHLTRALEGLEGEGGTDLVRALDHLAELAPGHANVFLFSDLFDPSAEVITRLQHLRARKHEVAVFHILDPWEVTFPFHELTEFVDIEDSERVVVSDPRGVREAYLEEMAAFIEEMRKSCFESDLDYLTVTTDMPPERVLFEFLAGRQ